eukprot:gene16876-biopygen21836
MHPKPNNRDPHGIHREIAALQWNSSREPLHVCSAGPGDVLWTKPGEVLCSLARMRVLWPVMLLSVFHPDLVQATAFTNYNAPGGSHDPRRHILLSPSAGRVKEGGWSRPARPQPRRCHPTFRVPGTIWSLDGAAGPPGIPGSAVSPALVSRSSWRAGPVPASLWKDRTPTFPR